MFRSKTSLGIDISSNRVSFALIGEFKGELRLIKAGGVDLAEGIMADGNIVRPVELGKCLRKLLRSNGVSQRQASVSLAANPSLIQIVDMPAAMPENIGQFVKSEIRHSAILSGKDHCFDYYGLGNKGGKGNNRMVVSATDSHKLTVLLKTLSVAGIDPVSVTPAMIGWLRALYSRHVMKNYDSSILFTVANDTSMTICVFSKGRLDFVRNSEIPIGLSEQEYMCNILSELNAVQQYYDIEVAPLEDKKWKIVVEIDSKIVPLDQVQNFFGNTTDDICVCSSQNAVEQISISASKSIKTASIASVGFALEQFDKGGMKIALDLVPEAFNKARKARKYAFIAASIVAVMLSFILISSNLMGPRFARAEKRIESAKESLDFAAVLELTRKNADIDEKMSCATQRREFMLAVSEQNGSCDWAKLLDTLVEKSSNDLCITSVSQTDGHAIAIEGKVFQHKSAYSFAGLLAESEMFKSAEVVDMHKDDRFKGLINYTINCVIENDRSEKSDGQ